MKNLSIKTWGNKKSIAVAVLSGILCATSYPPFYAWAAFFCFAPLWVLLYKQKSAKNVFILSFITQFIITLIGFYWVAYTAKEFGHIPVPLNILVLIAFCCIANMQGIAAALGAYFLNKKLNLRPAPFFFTLAVLYSFFEFFIPNIFPWNMGYSLLFSSFKSAQLAEYFGFNILSLLILFANALFALAYFRFPQKSWSRPLLIFVFGLFLTETLGQRAVKGLPPPDKSFSAMIVQANIGSFEKYYEKFGNSYQAPIVEELFTVTRKALQENPKPDILIWPETAYPASLDRGFSNGLYQQKLFEFIKNTSTTLITGAFSQDKIPGQIDKDYNGLFAFDKEANAVGLYRKTILLAFGEYIPGAHLLPFLDKIVPEISELAVGTGPLLLQVGSLKFSPIICYEALYGSFVAASSVGGSDALLNITNDSWYGNYSEQWQHMIMSVARSVELRKPLLRATNTGFSVISDVSGKVIAQGGLNQIWAKTVNVPYYSTPYKSLYSQIYKLIPFFLFALVVITVLLDIVLHASKRTRLD